MHETIQVDIRYREKWKIIHIGGYCTQEERSQLVSLCKEFKYVFAWTYEKVKIFSPQII